MLRLQTAATPRRLLQTALNALRDPDTCVVVPSRPIRQALLDSLQAAGTPPQWLGARCLTVPDLQRHAHQLTGLTPLTGAEWEELVLGALARVATGDLPPVERQWATRQWADGQPLPGVRRSLARTMADLDDADYPAEELVAILEAHLPPDQALGMAAIYRLLREDLAAGHVMSPRALRGALASALAGNPLPWPATQWVWIGLDGLLEPDGAVRMALALGERDDLVSTMLLWAPDDLAAVSEELPGQESLLTLMLEQTGGVREVVPGDDLPGELVRQAFAWDQLPTVALPLTFVDTPDIATAMEWVLRDAKQRILRGLPPEELAIVAPREIDYASDTIRLAAQLGLPVVVRRPEGLQQYGIMRRTEAMMALAAGRWEHSVLTAALAAPSLSDACQRVIQSGPAPTTAAGWLHELRELPAEFAPEPVLLERLQELATGLEALTWMLPATPGEWVKRYEALLRLAMTHDPIPMAERTMTWQDAAQVVRQEVEALNASMAAMHGWARGRELAHLAGQRAAAAQQTEEQDADSRDADSRDADSRDAAQPQESQDTPGAPQGELTVTAARFLEAWTYYTSTTTLERTAVEDHGIWWLAPEQAMYRRVSHVYLVGLQERAWEPTGHGLDPLMDDAARQALRLTTRSTARARQQLMVQQSLGLSDGTATIVTAHADARGRAVAPNATQRLLAWRTPTAPRLRVTAQQLRPQTAEDLLAPDDLVWLAPPEAPAPAPAVPAPVAPNGPDAQGDVPAAVPAQAHPDALPNALPNPEEPGAPRSVVTPHTVHSPSTLTRFAECGLRVQLEQLMGPGSTDREPDEDGTRLLLHRLWRAVQPVSPPDEPWSPAHEDAMAPVWQRLHRDLTLADQMSRGARAAIRRGWETLADERRAMARPDGPLRTRVLDSAALLGGERAPLAMRDGDVQWFLRSEIARIEVIEDERLTGPLAQLQGRLFIRQLAWQQTESVKKQRTLWVEGEDIILPLQAALVAEAMQGELWGWEVVGLQVGNARVDLTPRTLRLVEGVWQASDKPPVPSTLTGHPVRDAVTLARQAAVERILQMRAGNFPAKPGWHCGACPVRTACPKSESTGRRIPPVARPLRILADGTMEQ